MGSNPTSATEHVSEWLKERVCKTRMRKQTVGSNPTMLSKKNFNTKLLNMDAIEMAKDIIATLEDFVNFTEPDEIEPDYEERIKEAYELLVEY